MSETNNIELRSEKVRQIIGKVPPVLARTGAFIIEAAAKLPLKRGRICIYWDVQLMGTQKQVRSKLEKEIAGGF